MAQICLPHKRHAGSGNFFEFRKRSETRRDTYSGVTTTPNYVVEML